MGYSSADAIQIAGEYLISRLSAAIRLPYSTFYDGTEETSEQLTKSLGQEDTWYCAEHLIDLAVNQLEAQGIVETQPLATKLADGEDDYLIELTEEGSRKLKSGFTPEYRDAE